MARAAARSHLLAGSGSISGRVVSAASKAGIQGIEACAYDVTGESGEACVVTGATGEYTVTGLAAGEYVVQFLVPYNSTLNYVGTYYGGELNYAEAKRVVVSGTGGTGNINAELQAGAVVSGRVVAASTKTPVPGIEICAYPGTEVGEVEGCAESNSNGEYTVRSLQTGKYVVDFFVAAESTLNYLTQYYPGKQNSTEATEVATVAGSTTAGINAELAAGGEISGKVTSAATKSALAGVEVCVEEGPSEYFQYSGRCANTNASGEYLITSLATGSYPVEFMASAEGGDYLAQFYPAKSNASEATPVSVTAGTDRSAINAELLAGGNIRGKVTSSATKAALAGITVCASAGSEASENNCASTNEAGEYEITRLGSGAYTVTFSAGQEDQNFLTQYYNGKEASGEATSVPVTAGATTSAINAALDSGGQITGIVTSAASHLPISQVEVCTEASGREPYEYFNYCEYTNASGEYAISRLSTGKYEVRFSAERAAGDYVSEYYNGKLLRTEADPVAVTAAATTGGVDAALQTGGQITGTVTAAATGKPVTGVEVCALPTINELSEICADTNTSGEYTVVGLPTGSYTVEFLPQGSANYLVQYYNGKSAGEATDVAVTDADVTSGINAALSAGGEITGTVTDALTHAPLAGIYVCASASTYEYDNCADTNTRGEYVIPRLQTNEYKVSFSAQGITSDYLNQYYDGKETYAAANPVAVTTGSTRTGIDVELVSGGQITGKVTAAATGTPIQGIEVCASPAGAGGSDCATSDAGGEYTIERLTAGQYDVEFSPEYLSGANYIAQYYSGKQSASEATPVAVTLGATASAINASMLAGGQISGKVTDSATKAALKGITVCATPSGGEYSLACASTNTGGEYSVGGLPTGKYTVEFSEPAETPSHQPQYYNDKTNLSEANPVAVTAGATTADVNAALLPGGQISGKVTSAGTGKPLAEVRVCAETSGQYYDGRCTTTNTSGEYEIANLSPGTYTVSFYAETAGYLPQYYNGKAVQSEATSLAVTGESVSTGINAALALGGQITGTVTSASTKDAVKAVEVCAFQSADSFFRCTYTGSGGEYAISGVPTGEYTISFRPEASNYLTQYYKGKTNESEATKVSATIEKTTAGIDAELISGAEIAGRVTNAATKAPVDATDVCARNAVTDEYADCVYTNSSGEYDLLGLPTGSYSIEFNGEEGQGESYVTQYYNDASELSKANPVTATAGQKKSEINAALVPISAKPANIEAPDITGGAFVGATDICGIGRWSGSPAPTYAFQWLRDGSPITGATGTEYTVQTQDQGHSLSCEVTAKNSVGETSAKSNAVDIPAETNTGPRDVEPPSVTGATTVGAVLSCAPGTWTGTPTPTFAYQWLREGSAISGATGSQYTLQAADAGHNLVCEVTASNSAGKATAASVQDAIPAEATAQAPVLVDAPAIIGSASVGSTLSCTSGTWSGNPAPTYTYEWLRDGAPISGATTSTYAVSAADQAHALACRVTATNSAGKLSAASSPVAVPAAAGGTTGTGTSSTGETHGTGGVGGYTSTKPPSVSLVGAISGKSGIVTLTLRCPAGTINCASASILISVVEQIKGGHVIGVTASSKSSKRTVTIAAGQAVLAAGATKTLKIVLNGSGKTLLAARGKIPANVKLTSEGHVISSQTLTITPPAKKRKH